MPRKPIENNARQLFKQPASSAPTPKYFTSLGDHGTSSYQNGSGDGYSLYRAIARPLVGDASDWPAVRDAMLHFALTVRSTPSHPLHTTYMQHEWEFRRQKENELFAVLDCPDIAPTLEVLWVTAYALDISLRVMTRLLPSGEAQYQPVDVGPKSGRLVFVHWEPSAVTFWTRSISSRKAAFSSLLPDTSGKALIMCLQDWKVKLQLDKRSAGMRGKFNGLELNQISWTWIPTRPVASATAEDFFVRCYNGFRNEAELQSPGLLTAPDRMDTFAMVVSDPRQVRAALDVFDHALRNAPSQRRDVYVSKKCRRGRLLPCCSADVEFLRLPRHLVEGKSSIEITRMVERGEVQEICSVLTLGIGRHFSVMFNVAHMLEHTNRQTVPALEYLFHATIFNTNLLKLWWNPQVDFRVLENTITYLYQGTPRRRDSHVHNHTGLDQRHHRQPRFHIQSYYLNGVRPQTMGFAQAGLHCDLHRRGQDQPMACPCRLGNIDVASLLNHFCRVQGLNVPKMEWTETRENFNYSNLLELTLRGHRLLPLLRYMKSCHKDSGSTVLDFFQGQGQPDMATDDLYMAYNVVDVFGLNLIVEQIIGAEDKKLVARMLLDYHQGKAVSGPANRILPQRVSPLGYTPSGIPLFEDNPKSFIRKQFDPSKIAPGSPEIRTDASLSRTECLKFWEHDERVQLIRRISAAKQCAEQVTPSTAVYSLPSPAEREGLQQRKDELLKQLTDPTRLWLPETCATILKQEHPNVVVRAGESRAEALIRQLRSPIAAKASPPPGFGAAPGFLDGLPLDLQVIPGASLPAARNIFNAFRQGQASGELLGEPKALPNPPVYISWHRICKKARAENLIEMKRARGYEDPEQEAKKELEEQVAEEVRLNAANCLPSIIDHRDVWDPEGREYRRTSESTPVWNRPFLDIPRERTEGGWMSMATETLKHVERAIATKERRMAKIRSRNWRASKV